MWRLDHLFTHAELTDALQDLAAAAPDLMEVTSIGRSHEGRDIWLATVTDRSAGSPHEKPAVWVDANIHSVEITGSMAALHLLRHLVTRRDDERVARCLATRTFYVVPRVNPDGAELALGDDPVYLRSSTRIWPPPSAAPGLHDRDVDGDGRIVQMRVPDPAGPWKKYHADPRIMVPRDPEEVGAGPYYQLYPEGFVEDYDGHVVDTADDARSLDLNRNFPAGWRTNGEQPGAGPFPGSEPEVNALMAAIVERPNICAYVAHHTFSAAILRPYDDRPDDEFPAADLRRYRTLTAKGAELTGYRAANVFADFRYGPKEFITGSADGWAYEHQGVFGWTTEFWSPMVQSGITDHHLINWFDDHPVSDDLAMLAWNDGALGKKGFVDWHPFDHPQLGPVEIGGWDWFRCWENAPDEFLESEVAPHSEWEIHLALVTPLLRVTALRATNLGGDLWRIDAAVHNDGWLPTNVSQKALDRKIVDGVRLELVFPAGGSIISGLNPVDVGQLTGRERVTTWVSWKRREHTSGDRASASWVVRAEPDTSVELVATHARAGTDRAELSLAATGLEL